MQFPVPQFTDVEDKIVAGLTLKQFGILFGAAIILFLFYSATKNILATIIVFVFIGLPALAIAFGRVNGRPLYLTLSNVMIYFIHPREMLFHKQGTGEKPLDQPVPQGEAVTSTEQPIDPAKRLDDLKKQLEQQREQESTLAKNL